MMLLWILSSSLTTITKHGSNFRPNQTNLWSVWEFATSVDGVTQHGSVFETLIWKELLSGILRGLFTVRAWTWCYLYLLYCTVLIAPKIDFSLNGSLLWAGVSFVLRNPFILSVIFCLSFLNISRQLCQPSASLKNVQGQARQPGIPQRSQEYICQNCWMEICHKKSGVGSTEPKNLAKYCHWNFCAMRR